MRCILNAPETFTDMLRSMWMNTTLDKVYEKLSKPDVTVTNQSDKEEQLPKLLSLDEFSKRMWQDANGPLPS